MTWSAKPTRPRRLAFGYTLIELLVVLGIISVALGAVGLTLRPVGGEEALVREVERLLARYDGVRAHANADGTVWTLRITEQDYRWQPESTTSPAPKALTQARRLPPGLRLRFLASNPDLGPTLQVLPGDDVSEGRLLLDRPEAGASGSAWLDFSGHGPAVSGAHRP